MGSGSKCAKRLLLFTLLCLANVCVAQDAVDRYSFGVVPQQSTLVLANSWIPVLKLVGEQAGVKIDFVTAPSIKIFEQRLSAGEYDFAYMNPYHYTVFSQVPGYQAFAKQANKSITGIIVVRKDSGISKLAELEGAQLAFPSPAAFAASILTQAEFAKQGITIEPVYVSSHDSVYQNVARGIFPAGGGINRTLLAADEAVSGELKVLFTTDEFTPHAFVYHPRVPQAVYAKVQKAMVALNTSEEGREVLSDISFQAIVPAHDSDWDDVRSLDITLLGHLLKAGE